MLARQRVQSSSIKSVGHDPETGKLHIEFHGYKGKPGRIAEYDNVPADKHAALTKEGDSVGEYFHRHIRENPAHAWRYIDGQG